MNSTPEQREEQAYDALETEEPPTETPAEQLSNEGENRNDLPPEADFSILPVVGLGGSAGSVRALQEFFGTIKGDTGLAFVVVMHLAPDADSRLQQILQHRTQMPVVAVAGETKVEANHVYVIPPGHHLAMEDGHLRLEPLENEFGKRVAVDLFFRTLAASRRSRAVAVVLSGLDSDGAIGIKRIKENGGVTVAQAPEEAEHEGMPRAAINTGMVDWVLPVAQIASRLEEFARNEPKIHLPNAEVAGRSAEKDAERDEVALREILAYLHARTRRDFAHYKRATVLRRIMRRLQVNNLTNLPEYLHFLRSHAGEVGALLQDLLISVTNFFRDPEAFEALSAHIPSMFNGKGPGEPLRVWVTGCATGEEAYSLAMMLVEYADTLVAPPAIQLFATDIDEEALKTAREGRFPQAIAADVSPERLRRFFQLDQGMYRVRADLRDMVLFAVHNLLGDPPFSRMDLVSCRNLLIYFGPQAQEKAFGVFHFSLKPEGLLFLGGSESPDGSELFSPLDKKLRIYRRRAVPRTLAPVPFLPSPQPVHVPDRSHLLSALAPPTPPALAPIPAPGTPSFGELHLHLLELMAPPSVLVNAEYEILHLSPEAGKFLGFVGGSATTNLVSVVQPSLRLELRAALFQARSSGEDVSVPGLSVRLDGSLRSVDLQVRPLRDPERPDAPIYYLLVVFDERREERAEIIAQRAQDDGVAQRLSTELDGMKSYLRQTVEQYEATTEELKASNEELQAMNEELRSASEELETSREELQATNEELLTLNAEMKSKVEQLSQSNGDLQNLIASTDIATVFLDRELRVKRYTPRALDLFRLEATDLGRHLSDLRNRLATEDSAFIEDAERVLDQLATVEREVQSDGRFYLLRVSPYRTQDNRIDGVILSFVDISLRKRAEEELRQSEERLQQAMGAGRIFSWEMNPQTRHLEWSDNMEAVIGFALLDNIDRTFELIHPDDRQATLRAINASIEGGGPYESEYRVVNPQSGDVFWLHSQGALRLSPRDGSPRFVGVTQNVTERKRSEEERARLNARIEQQAQVFNTTLSTITDFAYLFDRQGRFTYANPPLLELLGVSPEEIVGKNFFELGYPADLAARLQGQIEHVFSTRENVRDETPFTSPEGEEGFYEYIFSPVCAPDGTVEAIAGSTRDVTERKRREQNLAFLAEVSRLSSAEEIVQSVGQKIGLYLGVATCNFQDVDAQGGVMHSICSWNRGDVPSAMGTFAIEEYALGWSEQARAGETITVRDVETDARTDAGRYQAFGVRAFVGVPFLRDGVWKFLLSVTDTAPRDWNDEETELFRELANRILPRLERARAEEELQDSDKRLRIAIDAAQMGTWEWDLTRDEVFWNERHFLLFGMEPHGNPVRPDEFFQHVHPGDRERVREELRVAVEDKSVFDTEFRIVLNGGEVRWMSGYGRVVETDEGERATRMSGVMLDISSRKAAEELLRQSEARARALISNLPGGAAFIVDPDERYVLAEGEALEKAGLSSADFVGKTLSETVAPEQREVYQRLYRLARQGETFDLEHQIGSRWFATRGVPLRDGDNIVAALAVSYDITDRKRIEEALREGEERLRLVMDSVTEYAIMTLDPNGLIMTWNPGAQRAFGWTADEAIGQHTSVLFTPEDRAANAPNEEMRVAREEGRAADERWHLRKDGSRLFVSGVLSPLRDGQPKGFVKVARDLTRERQAQAALRESEARFRTLSDAVPQIIWANDGRGEANYFNSRWFDYSGLSLEDSLGLGWQRIVHPDDEFPSKELWRLALENGKIFDTEYRLRRHDGAYRWFIGRNVPLRDGEGNVMSWFGTATDIHDLKEAEAQLRESGEKFRAMFEQSTAGVAEYDLDGNHIFVNATLCASLGYSADELLALNMETLVHPDDLARCEELFERAKAEPGSLTTEKRLCRKNGEVIWVRDSVSAIRNEHGQTQSVVAVIIDITERKAAEDELQRSHELLEVRVARRTRELAQALERVSAEVEQRRRAEAGRAELMKRIVNTQEDERGRIARELHDNLGQHLTAVMLGLQALETQIESLNGGENSQRTPQLDKLRELVDGLMRAAHRQAWELRPAELDAMGLEAALGQYIRDWSAGSGVPVDLQAVCWDERADPTTETTLYRVVQEALTNVARHANATQVSVVLERNAGGVAAIIEDDGEGFDPELQDTGRLGLLGMRERLALVGGSLEIESEPGFGTTIFARVPVGASGSVARSEGADGLMREG